MDGAESVRSGRSERSDRSHRSHGSHHSRHHHHRSRGSTSHNHRTNSSSRMRDDRSVTIQTPGNGSDMDSRLAESEKIEVQILPQDDNWGDNTTAYTGNTSETGFSMDEMRRFEMESFDDDRDSSGIDCCRYLSTGFASLLSMLGFFSPVAMVVLPRLKIGGWETMPCAVECEGLLISMAFKLLILLIGTVALFFHRPRATMPRVFVFRVVVLFLVFVLCFAFWLFYGVKIMQERDPNYYNIVQFSVHLVDALLFIHYIAIILIIIRQLQPQYVIHIVRSPDGESRTYTIGNLSIQRAAVWVLEQYYKDFQVYNPYLENVMKKPMKMSGLKFYDVDGGQQPNNHNARSRAMFAAAARRRDASHNDRFYEEQEYDRRVRKRRARLMTAAEEAFTHIKRMQDENGPAMPMDPQEAAQAVFPSMARPLQKYLRVTRQQPRYSMEAVLQHLGNCISHDMSARAFIERYMSQGVVIMNAKDYKDTQKWVLICEQLLTREIEHGLLFQLRQKDVSILCSVRKLPHFNITEEVIDPKSNKFVLKLSSETSV